MFSFVAGSPFSRRLTCEPIVQGRDYPCPCHCGGQLVPIALTDAMGCFDCEQLFLLVENGAAVVKPDSHPWTRAQWRWAGEGWYRSNGAWVSSPLGIVCWLVGLLWGGGCFCAFAPLPNAYWFLGVVGIATVLMLLLMLVMLLSFRPWRE